MKRFLIVMYTYSSEMHLSKDPCSYLYYLSRYYGWNGQYVYFSDKEIHNSNFEKYCTLLCLGKEKNYNRQKEIVADYLRKNINNFDVLMLFNYGSTTYKTARIAKKYNKNIYVYCKLDMNNNSFTHFYDGSLIRKIKSFPEIFKTRNIDLFTVENTSFYRVMKEMRIFRNRIEYLPNCVSLYLNDHIPSLKAVRKENIVVTISRLGDPKKNNELLLDAISLLPNDLITNWHFLFIGPYTDAFYQHYLCVDEKVRKRVTLLGAMHDRNKIFDILYKAKIFSLTSKSESFGIATIEAMYAGCYPVLTNYGDVLRDIIQDERYGVVIENNDATLYSSKLAYIMSNYDKVNCQGIHDFIEENFSYITWAGKLDKHLSKR